MKQEKNMKSIKTIHICLKTQIYDKIIAHIFKILKIEDIFKIHTI